MIDLDFRHLPTNKKNRPAGRPGLPVEFGKMDFFSKKSFGNLAIMADISAVDPWLCVANFR